MKQYYKFQLYDSHHLRKHFLYAILDRKESNRAIVYCFDEEDAKRVVKALNLLNTVLDIPEFSW
jgi:hypothetical protein